MIKKENRFDEYAYRVASLPLDESVDTVEEGQWVTVKGGKIVLATGSEPEMFLAIGSKRAGRDQVSGKAIRKISFLVGRVIVSTDQFDMTKTYSADMTALTVKDGKLVPVTADEKVVATAIGGVNAGYLRIVTK